MGQMPPSRFRPGRITAELTGAVLCIVRPGSRSAAAQTASCKVSTHANRYQAVAGSGRRNGDVWPTSEANRSKRVGVQAILSLTASIPEHLFVTGTSGYREGLGSNHWAQ